MRNSANEKKLIYSEAEQRVNVAIDKSIKKVDDGVNGLMKFGGENGYPQLMERLINGSVTGKAVTSIYSKFLAGLGFENEAINNIKVGTDSRGKKITLKSLLRQVAFSAAMNAGYYIHCNYELNNNADAKIKSVYLHDFKNCRFAKEDDTGFSAKILVYDNWLKEKEGARYDKNKVQNYHVFNSDKTALNSSIKKAIDKGEKFKGQVYFEFLDNQFFYPLSPLDSAYLDLDNEAQISLFENRELRNGFYGSVVIRMALSGSDKEKQDFVNGVKKQMGADGDRVTIIRAEVDEETGEIQENGAYKMDTIPQSVEPALFEGIKQHISDNIRKAMGNVPKVFLDYDAGALSSASGETLKQAVNFMNSLTSDARAQIEESFSEIFSNFENEELANNDNWKIKELELIQEETTVLKDM